MMTAPGDKHGLPDTGLSDDELPDRALVERIWRVMSRWAVPVMMSLAYLFLAATSETNNTGRMWMGVGLLFVLVVWFMFREMTETAGLARALSVGEVARLEALAHRTLARTRRPAARARMLVARAFAHQLRGQFAEAVATLDELGLGLDPAAVVWLGPLGPLASAIRIGALVELGRPVDAARAQVIRAAGAPALGWLIDGALAEQAGERDEAARLFARVIDDIRAGAAIRAIAHVHAARLADAAGDAAGAARHRAAAASLAMPEASWLRGGAG